MKSIKRSYLPVVIFLLGSTFCFAQVQIKFNGSEVPSGSTNTSSLVANNETEFFDLEFKNVSTNIKNYTVIRNRLEHSTDWTNTEIKWALDPSFSVDGICIPGNSDLLWTTPISLEAINDQSVYLRDSYSVSNESCIHYRYYILSAEIGLEDSIDVIGCSVLSVNELPENKIALYPNPAMSNLEITSSQLIEKVELANLNGTIFFNQYVGAEKASILLDTVSSGTYLLLIYTSEGIEKKKVEVLK